jgi:hypothetical protein
LQTVDNCPTFIKTLLMRPSYLQLSKPRRRELLQKPWLKPMAAQHLAAFVIQRAARSHLNLVPRSKPILRPESKQSALQRLRSKFLATGKSTEADFKDFCAAKLQAAFKMQTTRRVFRFHRFSMYHVAALQIQWGWRNKRMRDEVVTPEKAAARIQRAWRGFTNARIFKYYKQMIEFKQT